MVNENRNILYVAVDLNAGYKTDFLACSLLKRNFLYLT